MKITNIEIRKKNLAIKIATGLMLRGPLDPWAIYVNRDGRVDLRHNTESMFNWFLITEMSPLEDYLDSSHAELKKHFLDNEKLPIKSVADWIISQWHPNWTIEEENETIKITIV